MRSDLLPANAATTTALAAVSTVADAAASNATSALTSAAVAQTDAAAAVTAAAAKVPLTGTKTIAGATDFTTTPTVSTVPVATTEDIEDYAVPLEQAATFDLTDYDTATDTGDVVITAGGKAFTFTYDAGVLQGGMSGTAPVEYEDLVILRYDGGDLPTSATANLWDSTKPSSGGPVIQWDASPAGTDSTYRADAFATGTHGWRFAADESTITLPTSQTPEPGAGRGLVAMSMRDVAITGGFGTSCILRFRAGATLRFGFYLTETGGVKWIADGPTAATQTVGTFEGETAIVEKLVFAVVLQGASSKVLIATSAGTQELTVDLTGVLAYDTLDLSTYDSIGPKSGSHTVHEIIWGPDGYSADQVTAAMQALAENIGLTIGA